MKLILDNSIWIIGSVTIILLVTGWLKEARRKSLTRIKKIEESESLLLEIKHATKWLAKGEFR